MEFNVYDKDELTVALGDRFHEARTKVVLSFTNDDLKLFGQGEMAATGWIQDRNYGGEYRIIVQGRRVGEDQARLYDAQGRPVIRLPLN